jgi:23S rRNA pseudouridine1911/1915/1917 synthase
MMRQLRPHLPNPRACCICESPLIADTIYGGRPAGGIERQALHAERLAFEHPITGEEMAFEAGLPPDMLAGCEALGLEMPD